MNCIKCGKSIFEIGAFLTRVNDKGGNGIWECSPSCAAELTQEQALLAAVEGPEQEPK
jgi:hypothetical protein